MTLVSRPDPAAASHVDGLRCLNGVTVLIEVSERRQLTGVAYRLLGSVTDAEDAVQETFIRAWRGYDRFEGQIGRASCRERV